jgi:hypothetical protein
MQAILFKRACEFKAVKITFHDDTDDDDCYYNLLIV